MFVNIIHQKKMRNKSLVIRKRQRKRRRRMRGRGFMDWLKSAGKWVLSGVAGLAGDALGGPLGGAVAGGITSKLLGNGKKKRFHRRRRVRRLK